MRDLQSVLATAIALRRGLEEVARLAEAGARVLRERGFDPVWKDWEGVLNERPTGGATSERKCRRSSLSAGSKRRLIGPPARQVL